jgi:hypothetical protein
VVMADTIGSRADSSDAFRSPRRWRGRTALVALIVLAALAALGGYLALRPASPAARAATIVGAAVAHPSGSSTAAAMKQAARLLVDGGRSCRSGDTRSLSPRCGALFSAGAALVATAADVTGCPPAPAYQAGRDWQRFLTALSAYDWGRSPRPGLPPPPSC